MWFNPIIIWLLKSPFHGLLSKSTMLITCTGRKSGKTLQVPVNYLREGAELLTTSSKDRTWWRNLRGGAAVQLLLAGKLTPAHCRVCETGDEVAALLERIVRLNPAYAKFLDIRLDAQGSCNPDDLLAAAKTRVVVLSVLE